MCSTTILVKSSIRFIANSAQPKQHTESDPDDDFYDLNDAIETADLSQLVRRNKCIAYLQLASSFDLSLFTKFLRAGNCFAKLMQLRPAL